MVPGSSVRLVTNLVTCHICSCSCSCNTTYMIADSQWMQAILDLGSGALNKREVMPPRNRSERRRHVKTGRR